jgi:hypothetical protein
MGRHSNHKSSGRDSLRIAGESTAAESAPAKLPAIGRGADSPSPAQRWLLAVAVSLETAWLITLAILVLKRS